MSIPSAQRISTGSSHVPVQFRGDGRRADDAGPSAFRMACTGLIARGVRAKSDTTTLKSTPSVFPISPGWSAGSISCRAQTHCYGSHHFLKERWKPRHSRKGYGLGGRGQAGCDGSNYPLVEFSRILPAKTYWQDGVAKLLPRLALQDLNSTDRGRKSSGRVERCRYPTNAALREYRNTYQAQYVQAAYEVAKNIPGR